jgi:hypothetical protein
MHNWLTIGERGILYALEDEFGCEVRTNVRVSAGSGWINLHAAVVRDEDVVGIEVYEYKGGGFPYSHVQHIAEVGSSMKFDRFDKFILYVAVVSDVDKKLDTAVEVELNKLATVAPCKMVVRMYRLKELRTKYSL